MRADALSGPLAPQPSRIAAWVLPFLIGGGLLIAGSALAIGAIIRPSTALYIAGVALAAAGIGWITLRLLIWRSAGRTAAVLVALLSLALVLVTALGIQWLALTRFSTQSVQWTQPASARWATSIAGSDHIALQTSRQVDMYDRASGELLWSVTNPGGVDALAVGSDGSLVAWNQDRSTYYAPDGTRLWERATYRREDSPATAPPPLAIANGIVVVRDCPHNKATPRPCGIAGIGRTGNIAWERPGYVIPASLPAISHGDERPITIPAVAVIRETAETTSDMITLTAEDGREIDRRISSRPPVIAGDMVAFSDAAGSAGTMTGVRAGAEVWTTEGIPCPSFPLVLEHRLYGYLPGSGDTFTVDLRDGSWRETGALALWSGDDDRDATTGIAGADVIVYRNWQRLTGVDADTGEELWALTAPGHRVPGVEIGHGGIVVLARPGGHNPLMSAETRRNGIIVTVLDAGSGEETGRLLHEDGSVWESVPVGPGQAIVFTDSETMRLVGRP